MAKVQKWRATIDGVEYLVELENSGAASKQSITVDGEKFILPSSFSAFFNGRREAIKLGDEFFPLTIKPSGEAEIFPRGEKIEKIQ